MSLKQGCAVSIRNESRQPCPGDSWVAVETRERKGPSEFSSDLFRLLNAGFI